MHITHFLPETEGVERVDGQPLTKRTFAEGFLHRPRPVMLTNLQTDWPAGRRGKVASFATCDTFPSISFLLIDT